MNRPCVSLVAAVVVIGAATVIASAQGTTAAPPRIESVSYEIARRLADGWGGFGPFIPDPSTDGGIAREGDIVHLLVNVYDPDLLAATPPEKLFMRKQSTFIPYRDPANGVIYTAPEPPPILSDSLIFTERSWQMIDPTHFLVTISFVVPEWRGANQARVDRHLIKFDVQWHVSLEVSNDEVPSEEAPADLWPPTSIFTPNLWAVENPSLNVNENGPPAADAGPDQQVMLSSAGTVVVTLDGNETFDPWNVGFNPLDTNVAVKDRLSFVWEWISGPVRVDPTVSPDRDPAKAQVTLDHLGTYVYRLLVQDQVSSKATTDEVQINVVPLSALSPPPQAQIDVPAGPVTVGTAVTLDGSRSSDPDGDALSFRWRQTNALGGSLSAGELRTNFQPLSGAKTSKCTWVPTTPGTFYFRLLVVDPQGASNTAMVSLQAVAPAVSGETDSASTTPPPTGGTPSDQGTNSTPSDLFGCGNGLALPLAAVPALLCFMRGRRR